LDLRTETKKAIVIFFTLATIAAVRYGEEVNIGDEAREIFVSTLTQEASLSFELDHGQLLNARKINYEFYDQICGIGIKDLTVKEYDEAFRTILEKRNNSMVALLKKKQKKPA
jgi:hypothetical protein